jgi:hypothetical protein
MVFIHFDPRQRQRFNSNWRFDVNKLDVARRQFISGGI